jgi:hypothetical protein
MSQGNLPNVAAIIYVDGLREIAKWSHLVASVDFTHCAECNSFCDGYAIGSIEYSRYVV